MSTQKRPPNVVFILADNIGWGDLSCYGGTQPTPMLDSMAKNGLLLKNYTVEAQCTPTRSALMTGRLPVRSGTQQILLPGEGVYGLCPWEYTVADLLSEAGYATASFGKWHLGDVEGRLPTDHGFDQWWGIKNTSDEAGYTSQPLFHKSGLDAPQVWMAERGAAPFSDGEFDLKSRPFIDEMIAQKSASFIRDRARSSQPFFLYACFTNIHPPLISHPEFEGVSGGGKRADLLAELDARVGEIRDAIHEAGIQDDTILIFSSDNAALQIQAELGGSNGPWRGNFFTPPFEGSHRVPCIIEWSRGIAAGRVSNEMFSAIDWLPTLASLAGASQLVPTDRPIDGMNCSDVLLDTDMPSPRRSVVFHGGDGKVMSVKWESIKIVFRYSNGPSEPIVSPQLPMMFDLIADPGEAWNIFETRLDNLWMLDPALRLLRDLEESMKEYPNIQPGASFAGY